MCSAERALSITILVFPGLSISNPLIYVFPGDTSTTNFDISPAGVPEEK